MLKIFNVQIHWKAGKYISVCLLVRRGTMIPFSPSCQDPGKWKQKEEREEGQGLREMAGRNSTFIRHGANTGISSSLTVSTE